MNVNYLFEVDKITNFVIASTHCFNKKILQYYFLNYSGVFFQNKYNFYDRACQKLIPLYYKYLLISIKQKNIMKFNVYIYEKIRPLCVNFFLCYFSFYHILPMITEHSIWYNFAKTYYYYVLTKLWLYISLRFCSPILQTMSDWKF